MNKKVLVGMSGGVDSSVAAWLLQRQGYEVIGATMKLWEEETQDSRCCGIDDVRDAQAVCQKLGVPHYVFNYKDLFRREVVEPFIGAYRQGQTPNPCILCNRYLKFGAFLRRAAELGIDHIATGHYARIARELKTGRWLLRQGKDRKKDQSYFLYTLTQPELERLLLPCGDYTKEEIRAFASESGLPVAKKRDSQDICFVPDGDYAAFLERYTGKFYPSGDVLDLSGQVIGQHRGAVRYTIGQRKGLGLALNKPVYVCRKDMTANTVTVGPEQSLYSQELWADDVNWIATDHLSGPMWVYAKIRYRQTEQPSTVYPDKSGKIRLLFDKPQRAVTAGQAAVLYNGDIVVGGGTILKTVQF